MISDKNEALYLVDNESYLHLKEMEAGFAYEAFDKATGAAWYTGLITYEDMLENPIRNPLACARVMAIQEIGFKGEVVSGVALRTLDQIKDARRAYEMFFEALKKACPVPMGFEQIAGGAKGYFHTVENRIAIQEGMSQVQTVKTAIHEMTHQKLHSIDPTIKVDPLEPKLTRNHKEVEAESVAFTVCQHYGIDTGDYSFAYVAGWSHGKDTPELKASLDKIRKTASEMITEIDEHLAVLQKEYAWAHLTADDVKNIECIGSEYMPHSRMAEHTFSCEIVGEPMTLKLTVSQHDDGEGFTIHSEGKDVWDAMPESELRKLEPVLTSTAELHYWTSQIEKAETAEAVKEVTFGFMETENLGLSQEQCQKFWEVVEQKEAALSPPSALADLQAKKEKSEKEMSSKPKTKASQKKSKKQKKEESR